MITSPSTYALAYAADACIRLLLALRVAPRCNAPSTVKATPLRRTYSRVTTVILLTVEWWFSSPVLASKNGPRDFTVDSWHRADVRYHEEPPCG